jgi:hypothetical protein
MEMTTLVSTIALKTQRVMEGGSKVQDDWLATSHRKASEHGEVGRGSRGHDCGEWIGVEER